MLHSRCQENLIHTHHQCLRCAKSSSPTTRSPRSWRTHTPTPTPTRTASGSAARARAPHPACACARRRTALCCASACCAVCGARACSVRGAGVRVLACGRWRATGASSADSVSSAKYRTVAYERTKVSFLFS